jgi:hypothetical protein
MVLLHVAYYDFPVLFFYHSKQALLAKMFSRHCAKSGSFFHVESKSGNGNSMRHRSNAQRRSKFSQIPTLNRCISRTIQHALKLVMPLLIAHGGASNGAETKPPSQQFTKSCPDSGAFRYFIPE